MACLLACLLTCLVGWLGGWAVGWLVGFVVPPFLALTAALFVDMAVYLFVKLLVLQHLWCDFQSTPRLSDSGQAKRVRSASEVSSSFGAT